MGKGEGRGGCGLLEVRALTESLSKKSLHGPIPGATGRDFASVFTICRALVTTRCVLYIGAAYCVGYQMQTHRLNVGFVHGTKVLGQQSGESHRRAAV